MINAMKMEVIVGSDESDGSMEMKLERWKRMEKWVSAGLLAVCLAFCAVLFKAYLDGKFDSVKTLQQYVAGFGILAPFILTAIQAAQVVLPVLPGFLGCAVGAVLFGVLMWGIFFLWPGRSLIPVTHRTPCITTVCHNDCSI